MMRKMWAFGLGSVAALAACGGGGSDLLSPAEAEARYDAMEQQSDDIETAASGSAATPTSWAVPSGGVTYDGVFHAGGINATTGMGVDVPLTLNTSFSSGATSLTQGVAVATVDATNDGVNNPVYSQAGGSLNWSFVYDNTGSTRDVTATLNGTLTDASGANSFTFTNTGFDGGPRGATGQWFYLDLSGLGTMTLNGGGCLCDADYRAEQ